MIESLKNHISQWNTLYLKMERISAHTIGAIVSALKIIIQVHFLELVSKELNHLAAILHVYAGGLNFMK